MSTTIVHRNLIGRPLTDAATLAARLLLGAMFLFEGYSKVIAYAAAGGYMQRFGVPAALLPLVIATEIGAGLCLIVGWQTRWAALLLAGFSVAAAVIFHARFADGNQLQHFEKDFAIAGGLLALFASGAGAWALDRPTPSRD